jgi:replicative DNA helicase
MGSIFNRTLELIKENKERAEKGLSNVIPAKFTRFQQFVPGIDRKKYIIITASSGVGKSKYAKYMYVMNAYEQYLKDPNAFQLKIFYFCLEESKEAFMNSLISYKLFTDHGLMIPSDDLNSKLFGVTDEVLGYIEQLQSYFDEFEKVVEVVDWYQVPYAMSKYVSDYCESVGTWSWREYTKPDGTKEKAHDYFTYNEPNKYVIAVFDHINLFQPESGLSLHQTLSRFSSQYCLGLRDKYRCTIVAVQQQSADKERLEFSFAGKSIDIKLEPSLDGLGDNKLTQRDADLVLGLFAPTRYNIDYHRGYNVMLMGDAYRCLIVLKNREGVPNARIGLHFLGAVGAFAELPKSNLLVNESSYDDILRNNSLFNNG